MPKADIKLTCRIIGKVSGHSTMAAGGKPRSLYVVKMIYIRRGEELLRVDRNQDPYSSAPGDFSRVEVLAQHCHYPDSSRLLAT